MTRAVVVWGVVVVAIVAVVFAVFGVSVCVFERGPRVVVVYCCCCGEKKGDEFISINVFITVERKIRVSQMQKKKKKEKKPTERKQFHEQSKFYKPQGCLTYRKDILHFPVFTCHATEKGGER